MKILVLGGTRFFGVHLVKELLKMGNHVTIATRGIAKDNFGDKVDRIVFDRNDAHSIKKAFEGKSYDLIYDNIAYSSNDVKKLLDNVKCNRYIVVSSTAIYNKSRDTKEEDYIPEDKEINWGNREDFSYEEGKRQLEHAVFNEYKNIKSIAVRFPFVIGEDDYTERLLFYVENAIKDIPMNIDNKEAKMSFVKSNETGKFLAYLSNCDFTGTINGSNYGTISVEQILYYVKCKRKKDAIITSHGKAAPYNGEVEYCINTEKAESIGFAFTNIHEWIYDLLDLYINKIG